MTVRPSSLRMHRVSTTDLKKEGKNPFILDSKAPNTEEYKNFLMGEVRYNALARQNPARAEKLFDEALENAKDRYDYLTRLTKLYGEA